jgi:hypothetical protein
MSECKHGLKSGCAYCHAPRSEMVAKRPGQRTRTKPATRLSQKMNDRMTALQRRLKQIRGDTPAG